MDMLNHHCGVDRDPRGVVRLTICNAGSLNILGSAVTDGVREGLGDSSPPTGRSACWCSPARARRA